MAIGWTIVSDKDITAEVEAFANAFMVKFDIEAAKTVNTTAFGSATVPNITSITSTVESRKTDITMEVEVTKSVADATKANNNFATEAFAAAGITDVTPVVEVTV